MNAAGIIFSNIHDKNIADLTKKRTMASVPFGCRYRLVDFPLSNMVNSGITDISIITHYNYLSLMEHIGSGKDWDMARRSGGIRILAPYITAYANYKNELYNTRLEALMSVQHSISKMQADYVVLSDCDGICNIDLKDMIRAHAESGAVLTMAVKRIAITPENAEKNIIVSSDENGEITDLTVHPMFYSKSEADVNINVWVISRSFLLGALVNAQAHGYTSFSQDVIRRSIGREKMRIYRFDGYTPTSIPSPTITITAWN
jgi:glucose-1-phosphate adenylyltransferase